MRTLMGVIETLEFYGMCGIDGSDEEYWPDKFNTERVNSPLKFA